MARPSLSASTLKLFLECPRCFWLHINKRIERPRGPFPSLPSGMDLVLKDYFETYRRQGTLPPLIDGQLQGTLTKEPLTLGWTDEALDARLWGKLDDCLVLTDGRHAPLDHKTRASAPESEAYSKKYYKFQMDVYSFLLERNGYPISRTAYLVYYYPLTGVLHEGFPFGIALHRIETDPEGAAAVFRSGREVLRESSPPPSSKTCGYCRWASAVQSVPSSTNATHVQPTLFDLSPG